MKHKMLSAILCGLLITNLAGCAFVPPVETVSDEKSEITASAISTTEISDDTTAETAPETDITSESLTSQQPAEKEETEVPSPQTNQPVIEQPQAPAESSPTEQPKPEQSQPVTESQPTQKPEPTAPTQTEQPKQPEPTKEPEPVTPPEPEPKSIYDYEFDIDAIRAEMIALGEGMGLRHIAETSSGKITPDNSSWAVPVTASENFQGENLRRKLTDYVTSMPDIVTVYGGEAIQYFTIYTESLGNGSYRIYFLF